MQQTSSDPGAKTGSRKETPPGSKPTSSDEPRPGRFSFGWLFRRDGEAGRPSSPDAGKRKSHDASAKEAKISYSSSFFQQLYARTAKSSSVAFCDPSKSLDLSKHLCGMRSSFSSSDVQRYCHVTPPLPVSSSTYDARAKPEKVVLAMPPDETVACRLCLSLVNVRDMVSLEDCGCRFCWQCLRQYLSVNIREGNVILACPESHCRGKIGMAEIEKLVDGDVLDMFKRFKANREVEMDPLRTWCPMPGCSTVCHVRPAAAPDRGTPVFCPSCSFTFCSSCKIRWHATKTCEQVRKELRDEKEFPVSDEESSSIKRCPFCRIPIERDEGCAQMMCKNCKHVFCWYCLASLDDDFLLRHYDKGPCKNRLGHSRASVVWHRTQVVGIFAGFGFLLLIASPFLLLAAPCLLCCKCNKCFEQQDPPHAADP